MTRDSEAPGGPIETRWERHLFHLKLVNPANKRKHTIIVVGSGLAGASAAASLGELGYNVFCFCFQDSPRRAHSIAAQGGLVVFWAPRLRTWACCRKVKRSGTSA